MHCVFCVFFSHTLGLVCVDVGERASCVFRIHAIGLLTASFTNDFRTIHSFNHSFIHLCVARRRRPSAIVTWFENTNAGWWKQLNHSSEPNCEITFDNGGNCCVTANYDIQPGSPLTISLGDPTNPTPLFAVYGFLPSDCATIFCKAMHLDSIIKDLGYDFKDLLFQTQSGEIAPKVWDIFLYEILQKNDQGSADNFYVACKTNDESTKQEYHSHYFSYTLDALKQHVYSILADVEQLTAAAQSYDLRTHPRVPVIVAHNSLVRDTFTMTAALLEQMG